MTKTLTRRHQKGLSLIFALLALVALSVAAVAVIRSVDTSTLVLGNLGFKQETTALAEQGTQEAIRWLNLQAAANGGTGLENNVDGADLYSATAPAGNAALTPEAQLPLVAANEREDVDPDSPGEGRCAISVVEDAGLPSAPCPPGNELFVFGPGAKGQAPVLLGNVRYSVTRLCRNAGAIAGNDCVRPSAQAAGDAQDKSALDYARPAPLVGSVEGILYRVVVRAQGARDTTTFTETIVQR